MKLKREHFALFGNSTLGLKGCVFFLLLATGFLAQAQTISITATDAAAGEVAGNPAGNPASFTISRDPGNFSFTSRVTFSLTGTAEQGLDYLAPATNTGIANTVDLSAAQPSVTVTIDEILDDNIVEGL